MRRLQPLITAVPLCLGLAALLVAGIFARTALGQQPEGRLMRFPDISGDRIVFSYAGDLWLVSRDGGVARRITTHQGLELFPKFSPDGRSIAFTGQYDGNYNVYVMPAEGGDPKQLTFHPGGGPLAERMGIHNEVLTWFPDSKRIVYLSRRDTFNDWFGRPFVVSVEGGLPERLPIDKGGLMSFSPDGERMAYNRIFRNFRTWKRYTGGMAQSIWIYNFKANQIEEIPHTEWTDTFPMWHEETTYFDSDRGPEHRLNLYSYSLKTKEIRQLTHFTDFDVEWPSLGSDAIVFENGGYLYLFDLKTEKAQKLTIYLPGDRELARPHWANVARLVTSFDLSPDGKRALMTARGDAFTVPAKEGSVRNLTHTPGIREKDATWSPDGRWVAYLSDRSGEDELYITPQDGLGAEVRITTDGTMFRLAPQWSPDSKKLAFADKSLRLFYVDIDQKKPVLIDQGHYADLTQYVWSPDSRWVAYAKSAENHNNVIYLYSLADAKITPVTTDFYDSRNPAFDPDGLYLYFLSDRDYNEVLGAYDFEFANPKPTRVYAVTLRADTVSPFAPQSDEVTIKPPEIPTPVPGTPPGPSPVPGAKAAPKVPPEKPPQKPEATAEARKNPESFRVDLEGIGNRVVSLPVPPGSYRNLQAASGRAFYVAAPIQGLSGPLPGESPAIHIFDLRERKDQVLVEMADNFALSFDGSKLLYAARPGGEPPSGAEEAGPVARTFGIVDAKVPQPNAPPHKVGDGALNLSGLRIEVDPRAEWKQMFNEVWRQERDYFFEPSMNGVDWKAVRKKYSQLLPYVADRYDLTYVIGEMIGELSNSHTYVGGGDYPDLHPVNLGLLGADFEADAQHGLYRFKKIYPGENWNPDLRSPLTEPGVDVKEGDYLLAVNGSPLRVPQNPEELFIDTANDNVTLTVNSGPTEDGARHVVVKPLSNDFGLHQLDWIETNRRKVDKATGGRVGYIYLQDMSAPGLNQFVKQFFPQIRKEGLIIDVRYNGGGFVDQIIFERLRRVLGGMEAARNFAADTVPSPEFRGHMVCITNEYAASDGDYFSYFFKQYKLGPLIGERTWGGVRGIRGEIPLMDGGYITRPEFSLYANDSQWVIENHGVDPDVVVDNRPDLVMAGQDPQLEKAIELVMQPIKEHPLSLPPRPPDLPAYPSGPGR